MSIGLKHRSKPAISFFILKGILLVSTKSISFIRRSELSSAAFDVVASFGLRGTTLEKVGDAAGVSKGVVLHHFKDKSALLEAVFRRSNSLLSEAVVELYRYAHNPYDRLWSIIFANFSQTIFNHKVCQAWLSLAAEVPHNKECQRIQTACHSRIHTNLKHELRNFCDEEESERIAKQLGVIIDGIWVRAGLQSHSMSSQEAIDELEFALSRLLNGNSEQELKHKLARTKIENIATILMNSKAFKEKAL